MNKIRQRAIRRWVWLDGRLYWLDVLQKAELPPDAPRLLIVSYLPNEQAFHILRVCINAIQRFTPEPHEVWVVDNRSPRAYSDRLLELNNINIVFNRTEPLPRGTRLSPGRSLQKKWGSYANAVGLEIGARLIDPDSLFLMTMHMDVMPSREGWLSYLRGKINQRVRASGVRMDTARVKEGILHVLGYMLDFQLFSQLKLDFFPLLPDYDVGDLAIVRIRQAGFDVFACPNSLWDEKLVDALPEQSPFRSMNVDRSFDDEGNVIFLHLGRGIIKASSMYKGTTAVDWIKFADDYVLKG